MTQETNNKIPEFLDYDIDNAIYVLADRLETQTEPDYIIYLRDWILSQEPGFKLTGYFSGREQLLLDIKYCEHNKFAQERIIDFANTINHD